MYYIVLVDLPGVACTRIIREYGKSKNLDTVIANRRCFENVAKFKYLGTILAGQNFIQ
jgi:hypothetical protein